MIVLDASAVIALVRQESGSWTVEEAIFEDQVILSAVNYSETLQKLARLDVDHYLVEEALTDLDIVIASFNQPLARLAADYYRHGSGLSFADRACLATAKVFAATALTADKQWLEYASEFGVKVVDIRSETG